MNKWHVNGDSYSYEYPAKVVGENLPVGVYRLELGMFGFYLKKVSDKFHFPYKIYGVEDRLVKRVIKAFNNSNKNMGVLLNGIKGTGKTVTAKIICNQLNMPVILVNKKFDDNTSPNGFLSSIPQDLVIFVDEYEKIYKDSHELLTIMDGVFNKVNKRLFLLTTNELYVNANMIERPSRIRYLKTFSNLSPIIVEEVVDDFLENKKHKEDTIIFISSLKNITIDIVKAIVEEVNLFDEPPADFQDIFNVQKISGKYNVYCADPKDKFNKLLLKEAAKINPNNPTENDIEDCFRINGTYIGEIMEVIDKSSYNNSTTFRINTTLDITEEPELNETPKEKKEREESNLANIENRIKQVVSTLNGPPDIMAYLTDCIRRNADIVLYVEPASSTNDTYKYTKNYWAEF